MQIGVAGLGAMGSAIAARLLEVGHQVTVWNRTASRASELIAAQEGLGHRMQQAQVYYDLPTIFVGLMLIGILGMVMDRAILWADKRLTTWQERR